LPDSIARDGLLAWKSPGGSRPPAGRVVTASTMLPIQSPPSLDSWGFPSVSLWPGSLPCPEPMPSAAGVARC